MSRVKDPDLQQVLVFHHITTLQSDTMTQRLAFTLRLFYKKHYSFGSKWLKLHQKWSICVDMEGEKVRSRVERGAQSGTSRRIDLASDEG